MFFGKIPRLASGTSLLSFSLFLRPVLKFYSVRTSLMRSFALNNSERRSFIFSGLCLTQRSSCESCSSNWSQDFCVLPWNGWCLAIFIHAPEGTSDSGGSRSCNAQPDYIFHCCCCIFVTTLLRPSVWLFLNLPVRKWALCGEFTSRFWFKEELAFGRMPMVIR